MDAEWVTGSVDGTLGSLNRSDRGSESSESESDLHGGLDWIGVLVVLVVVLVDDGGHWRQDGGDFIPWIHINRKNSGACILLGPFDLDRWSSE